MTRDIRLKSFTTLNKNFCTLADPQGCDVLFMLNKKRFDQIEYLYNCDIDKEVQEYYNEEKQ